MIMWNKCRVHYIENIFSVIIKLQHGYILYLEIPVWLHLFFEQMLRCTVIACKHSEHAAIGIVTFDQSSTPVLSYSYSPREWSRYCNFFCNDPFEKPDSRLLKLWTHCSNQSWIHYTWYDKMGGGTKDNWFSIQHQNLCYHERVTKSEIKEFFTPAVFKIPSNKTWEINEIACNCIISAKWEGMLIIPGHVNTTKKLSNKE